MLSYLTLILASFLLGASAEVSSTYPTSLVYQFPSTAAQSLENICTRANGGLLLTTLSSPCLYSLVPTVANAVPTLLHTFTGCTSTFGIVEVFADVFVVVTGNISATTGLPISGSFALFRVDLSVGVNAVVSLITTIPGAGCLNGITAVPGTPGLILVADSVLGQILSVNINTKAVSIAIRDSLLLNTATSILGINGLRVQNGILYCTNTALGLFLSVPINPLGLVEGVLSVLSVPLNLLGLTTRYVYDDFALDLYGRAWVANHPNAIVRVSTVLGLVVQTPIVTAGLLVNPTSCAFGRGSASEICNLYVTCAGIANASATIGGSIVKINICV